MRQPKPWYWNRRGGWYVEVKGKQRLLGKVPRTVAPPKAVMNEFYAVMAAEGALTPADRKGSCVEDAVGALVASRQHLRARTLVNYQQYLGPFAVAFRGRKVRSLKADEVLEWVRGYQGKNRNNRTFNDGGRSVLFRHVDMFLRWAREAGYLDTYLWHSTPNPWKSLPRSRGMTEAEYLAIMGDHRTKACFREVIDFLYRTGARPGEISCLSARHLDSVLPIARLKPHEYKTGGKTGLDREIVFPPDLMEKLRAYARVRPSGTLLRTEKGDPWGANKISCRFILVKRRLGLDDALCPHMARHSFGTRALDGGTPIEIVAKLLGHTGTNELMRTYYHPATHKMVEVAAAVSGQKPPDQKQVELARGKRNLKRAKWVTETL